MTPRVSFISVISHTSARWASSVQRAANAKSLFLSSWFMKRSVCSFSAIRSCSLATRMLSTSRATRERASRRMQYEHSRAVFAANKFQASRHAGSFAARGGNEPADISNGMRWPVIESNTRDVNCIVPPPRPRTKSSTRATSLAATRRLSAKGVAGASRSTLAPPVFSSAISVSLPPDSSPTEMRATTSAVA